MPSIPLTMLTVAFFERTYLLKSEIKVLAGTVGPSGSGEQTSIDTSGPDYSNCRGHQPLGPAAGCKRVLTGPGQEGGDHCESRCSMQGNSVVR